MVENISFYGVNTITKEKALIKLLLKTIDINKNSIVFSTNVFELEKLDTVLWTSVSWLPHALSKDPHPNMQPVLLLDNINNIENNASYMFVLDTSDFLIPNNIEKLFMIFNLNDEIDVNNARLKWKEFKNNNYDLKFYKQDKEGRFNSVNM